MCVFLVLKVEFKCEQKSMWLLCLNAVYICARWKWNWNETRFMNIYDQFRVRNGVRYS